MRTNPTNWTDFMIAGGSAFSAAAAVIAILAARAAHKEQYKISEEALRQQYKISEEALRQQYNIVGGQTGILWRNQVLDLYDRGLTPSQIREIMHLETGGKGYEKNYGLIKDVIRDVPRRT